jgi:hypothetical protein
MNRASFSSSDLAVDNLIAGNAHLLLGKQITLAAGAVYPRGAVLGKRSLGAANAGFVGTGNGALTLDATTPLLAGAKAGAYTITCITAASNSGTFRVEDPNGVVLGDVAVGATFADQIKFVIADGATDFIVGDKFTVTVAAGTGQYLTSVAAAVDGSAEPDLVLSETVDATLAAKPAMAYKRGDFNASALTFGAGHSAATVAETLRSKGIAIL